MKPLLPAVHMRDHAERISIASVKGVNRAILDRRAKLASELSRAARKLRLCERSRLVISACYNREDAIHGTHCGIRTPKAEAKPKLESEADEEREHEGGRDVPR